MDKGTLGIHKIKLVIHSSHNLTDSSGIGFHADSALHLGEVTAGNNGRGLIVDTALEAGRAPVHKLDGSLGLDEGNGRVDILRDNITSVHHTAGHVLTVTRIALGHHVGRFKDRGGDLLDGELLVVSLLSRDDGGIRGKHEMDTRIRHQISLELGQIDVQGTIETEGSGQGRDNLRDESVQVSESGPLHIQVPSADIIDGFIVHHEGAVGVLQKGVGGQHRVIRLNNSSGDLRGRPDDKIKLGFLAVIDRETLEEKRSKARACATTNRVVDNKALEPGALISQLTDTIKAQVDDFLTNGVVTTGKVVGGIFLSSDELLRVIELLIGTGTNLVDNGGLEIEENGTRNVLASTSLGEEGVESVVTVTDGLV
jgi:hypothetical protein